MIFLLGFTTLAFCSSPLPISHQRQFAPDGELVRQSGIIPLRLSVFDEVDSEDELNELFIPVSDRDFKEFEGVEEFGSDRLSGLMDNLHLVPPVAIPENPAMLRQQARLRPLVVPVFARRSSPEPSSFSEVSEVVTVDNFAGSNVEDEIHPSQSNFVGSNVEDEIRPSQRPLIKRRLPSDSVSEEETLQNTWDESEFVGGIPCFNVKRRIDYFVTTPRPQRRIRQEAFPCIDDADDESDQPYKKWKRKGSDIILVEPRSTTV